MNASIQSPTPASFGLGMATHGVAEFDSDCATDHLRVIEIRPDGSAVVDTTGLARVVLRPGDEPIQELLPIDDAQQCADLFNSCSSRHGRRAVVVTYAEAARVAAAE